MRRRLSGNYPDRSCRLLSKDSLKDYKAGTKAFFRFCGKTVQSHFDPGGRIDTKNSGDRKNECP